MYSHKFQASIFIHAKVLKGSQILNLGHVTLTTPVIRPPVANTCFAEYAYQIWIF